MCFQSFQNLPNAFQVPMFNETQSRAADLPNFTWKKNVLEIKRNSKLLTPYEIKKKFLLQWQIFLRLLTV